MDGCCATGRRFFVNSSFRSSRRLGAVKCQSWTVTVTSPTTCYAPTTLTAAGTHVAATPVVLSSATSMTDGGYTASSATAVAASSHANPASTCALLASRIGSYDTLNIPVPLTSDVNWI